MPLTAPVTVPSFVVNDQRALDGLQWALDRYNAEQRAADPEWVDIGPMPYLRQRLLTWLHREASRHDPMTSNEPDILRAEILRLRGL
jgi:hypothetical protein